jgi:hypothetical protein
MRESLTGDKRIVRRMVEDDPKPAGARRCWAGHICCRRWFRGDDRRRARSARIDKSCESRIAGSTGRWPFRVRRLADRIFARSATAMVSRARSAKRVLCRLCRTRRAKFNRPTSATLPRLRGEPCEGQASGLLPQRNSLPHLAHYGLGGLAAPAPLLSDGPPSAFAGVSMPNVFRYG